MLLNLLVILQLAHILLHVAFDQIFARLLAGLRASLIGKMIGIGEMIGIGVQRVESLGCIRVSIIFAGIITPRHVLRCLQLIFLIENKSLVNCVMHPHVGWRVIHHFKFGVVLFRTVVCA